MSLTANIFILIALAVSLASSFFAWKASSDEELKPNRLALVQHLVLFLILAADLILGWALFQRNFSFIYVHNYTDSLLPWYYALSAFWAGQEGSFLFWTTAVALGGSIWALSRRGKEVSKETGKRFWLFFFALQAFFLMLLSSVSNPFLTFNPPPETGSGLNPLLQHPGMIFHPPLLFLGYAGFTVPACLALAYSMGKGDFSWLKISREWILGAWILLTAGIVLGAWWSYMELGWGGYWAWDPVENASLVPWLSASALVHTAYIGRRSKTLEKSSVFLIGLTLVLCFFATFLTRSGVLDSLHSFGSHGVGAPLLWGMVLIFLVFLLAGFSLTAKSQNPLGSMLSRQGGMVLLTWLLLALGLVIGMGTMWPVLSKVWSEHSLGLGPDFYNRVCLPLFVLVIFLLMLCPWLGWKDWKKGERPIFLLPVSFFAALILFWLAGIKRPLPLVALSAAGGICVSFIFLLVRYNFLKKIKKNWGGYGVHLGLALMAIGIAFSGPYKQVKEIVLEKGESVKLDSYTFVFKGIENYRTKALHGVKARIHVLENGEEKGVMLPERRMYKKFEQPFAEAAVIPGLGDELYATLLGSSRNMAKLQLSVNPMVNWIWIGAVLICLSGLLALFSKKAKYF